MRAHLRINACHVPMATVFPEDVYRACTFRSFCASKTCGGGTLKHGVFEFERGRPKREGGRSATVPVCRFGENPAIILHSHSLQLEFPRSDTDPARRTTYVISACTMQAYRRVPAADKDWCSGKCYLLCSRIKLWQNDQLSSIKTTGL